MNRQSILNAAQTVFVTAFMLIAWPSHASDDDKLIQHNEVLGPVLSTELLQASEPMAMLDEVEDLAGSTLENVGELTETAQRFTSNRFNRFVVQIDDFFGGAESAETENSSWGRIRLGTLKPAGENLEFKGRLKVKVVLPQAEQRLRLLFSTEDTDVTGSERRGAVDNEADQDAALALRFVRSLSDRLRLKFDIGARSRDSEVQIFGRISASNSNELPWGWEYRISNNFFLFSASGFENRFRVDLRKVINEEGNLFFRSSTSIEARNGFRGASVDEVVGVYADVNSQTAVAFEGLFSFLTSRDDEFDTRYLGSEFRIRYRRNVWRPWFYYEVWPTLSILASTDREVELGGLLRVEILFGQY